MDYKNKYDNSSSKIRRIYIPIPGYKYFHKPSDIDHIDSHFIEREHSSKKLKEWLSDNNGNDAGSYLITGYRGMGKTSFVGKVIKTLIDESGERNEIVWISWAWIIKVVVLLFPILLFVGGIFCHDEFSKLNEKEILMFFVPIIPILFLLIVLNSKFPSKLFKKLLAIKYLNKLSLDSICVIHTLKIMCTLCALLGPFFIFFFFNIETSKVILFIWSSFFLNLSLLFLFIIEYQKKYIHHIAVNIGNETKGERDILALIANSMMTKLTLFFRKKIMYQSLYTLGRSAYYWVVSLIALFIYYNGMSYLNSDIEKFHELSPQKIKLIEKMALSIDGIPVDINSGNYLCAIFGSLLALFTALIFVKYILDPIIRFVLSQFGFITLKPRQVLSKIKHLTDRINSSVDEESLSGAIHSTPININIIPKKSKKYQPASVREIEENLVCIINEIHDSLLMQSRFIIVLDELDKISGAENNSQGDCKKETSERIPEFAFDENGFSDEVSIHDKKRRTLHLLGQLKYFTSTSKAKFVFIAGRELYDAFLADVSDREFSVSSIFNGVINIDSFFTYNSQTKDVTKMTEVYLCKLLMGTIEKDDDPRTDSRDITRYSLKKYTEKLRKEAQTTSPKAKKEQEQEQEQEQEKIVAFLEQFITYLTFVSNGAPKKLTTQIEKNIIAKEQYKRQNEYENKIKISNDFNQYQIVNPSPTEESDYYLAFGYYDQQKIGFIHYIAYPIFENIISPSSEYGDKLLVSSSFLIAHIYKHHNSGFSWGNLEYLPELLESNRTPELREYIKSIIGYLGQMHLTTISSGIYTYKFPMSLVEEISVFTKKSEEISAIFNFSLDYSRAVKHYYYQLLKFYQKYGRDSEIAQTNLHSYLGDIHMANDEYAEAITQFRLAADILSSLVKEKEKEDNEASTSVIVRYARAMLKLGLAYEKRNTIDSAYMVYSDLALQFVKHREIKEEEFELKYKIDNIEPTENFYRNARTLLYKSSDYTSIFDKECHPKLYKKAEDWRNHYWIYGEELTDNLCDFMTPKKSALISKLSVFEDQRLAYLPILAKLFSIEKHNICGITKDNIKIAESEFNYLFLLTNSEAKYLLSVDFYRKLGDILYYKNKNFYDSDKLGDSLSAWGYDVKPAIFNYCYQNKIGKEDAEKLIKQFSETPVKYWKSLINTIFGEEPLNHTTEIINLIPNKIKTDRFESICACGLKRTARKEPYASNGCSACRYYNRSLTILKRHMIKNLETQIDTTKAILFINALREKKLKSYRHNELTQIALTLDSMGNIMLSCFSEPLDVCVIKCQFAEIVFSKERTKIELDNKYKYTHLEKSILYYLAAMEYHYQAANIKEGVHCLVKILNVLSLYLQKANRKPWLTKAFLANFNETFIAEAIQKVYSIRDFNNVIETAELESINGDGKKNLGFTSIMPEVEELLFAFYEFAFNNNDYRKENISALYNSPSLTYLRNESLTYNRIVSLMFKQKLNSYYFDELRIKSSIVGDEKDLLINEYKKCYTEYFNSKTNNPAIQKISNDLGVEDFDAEKLVEFLIADSIFCLSNIADSLSPTVRTTLFTNSFCGDVYENLYKWVIRKEALSKYYDDIATKDISKKNSCINNVHREICLVCLNRIYVCNYHTYNRFRRKCDYIEKIRYIHKNRASLFDNYIKTLIGEYSYNTLKTTRLKEMSQKYYREAIQMNTEGMVYQNFIKGFYILDDDLQNNTCQFYLAMERYKINTNFFTISDSTILKNDYYKAENYFKWLNHSYWKD